MSRIVHTDYVILNQGIMFDIQAWYKERFQRSDFSLLLFPRCVGIRN